MMDSINLLPEDLRSKELEKKPMNTGAPLRYTDPARPPRLDSPRFGEAGEAGPPQTSVAAGRSWWRRLFGHHASVSRPSVKPVVTPPLKGNGNGSLQGMHLPSGSNGNGASLSIKNNVAVDLAADKTILFSWVDFYYRLKVAIVSLVLVLVVLVGIYLIIFRWPTPLQTDEAAVSREIGQLKSQLSEFEKKKQTIAILDRRLASINQLLEQHLFWTKFFDLLEQNTIDSVYYTNLNVDESGQIILSATANNYAGVAAQIAVWQARPEITKVDFSRAALRQTVAVPGAPAAAETSAVNFELFLTLQKDFLNPTYGQD
ncbi:hypothetical protein HY933_01910 [Candidatus Falkowbacteria bacterium]|nr:hypothetical protein [Candidatus Falkowbacteria bacterium]